MKKTLLFLIIIFSVAAFAYSASYKNNPYQKLADEYTQKATDAFDAGEYDAAVEFSALATENSLLSEAYVQKMLDKSEATKQITFAQNQLAIAKKIKGDVYYPITFNEGKVLVDSSIQQFKAEDYLAAKATAVQAFELLSTIKESTPLPKYYVVRPWAETKDCFWNIAGRSYVYNNPTLWENLYDANKANLKDPKNPDLIFPGMKIEIPSLTGEYRDGTYDSKMKYDTYAPTKR